MNDWEWRALEERSSVDRLKVGDVELRRGGRVRLRPRPGGDVLDIALAGRCAMIEAIEQDYEGRFHVAVVIEDDPGHDLGLRRQPGHRFFFRPEEVDPVDEASGDVAAARPCPRVLIAGIGNIFCGDDGFGVEVAQRLARRTWPAQVRVVDFGIRGLDLAHALLDGYELSILVDACPRGAAPGTIYVIEPELRDLDAADAAGAGVDPHGMHPLNVLRLARTMEGTLGKILLVGCEPLTLGGEEGLMGLSEPVTAAVDEAMRRIEVLVGTLLGEREPGAAPEGQLRKGDASDGHTAATP